MAKSRLHVVPHDDGWAVKREGNEQASSTHSTQKEAIESARGFAKEGDDIVIHGSDGTIRENITYTGDSSSNGGSGKRNEIPVSDVMSVGSRVSWAAIAAGAVIALTLYFTLLLLALAIGITTLDDLHSKTFAIGATIVGIFTLLVSLFMGGMITSFFTVGENKTEALVYGVLLWAVFALMLIVIGSGMGIGFGAVIALTDGPDTVQISDEDLAKADMDAEKIKKFREVMAKSKSMASTLDPTSAAWVGFAGLLLSIFAAVGGAVTGAGPELVLKQLRGRRKLVVKT